MNTYSTIGLKLVLDNACCLCEKLVEETHIHLFSTCEWIVRVQAEMQRWVWNTYSCWNCQTYSK